MFTVCPKCALTLVVTAADLRVAQGYVRCGRCLNVFNALARLSEERPAAPPAPPPDFAAPEGPEPEAGPQPSTASSPAAADSDGEVIEIELDAGSLEPPERAPAESIEPTSVAQAVTAGNEPEPVAQSATATMPEDAGAGPGAPSDAKPSDTGPSDTEPSDTGPLDAGPSRSEETNTPPLQSDAALELGMRRPRAGLGWTLGAGALIIALALQIVNHYRDTLAESPALRVPLTVAYSTLGVKLAPHWNVRAYDVRQLGASVSGAGSGEIVVRASVKNIAGYAQPLPLLRVTLQDRFGNRIAARDVPPGDYLPSSVAPRSLLAAGNRVDATMVFVDPGPRAVGFEIDACLPQQRGEVACAHGP